MKIIIHALLKISGCQIKSRKFCRFFSKMGSAEVKSLANTTKNGIEIRIPIKTFIADREALPVLVSLFNPSPITPGAAKIAKNVVLTKDSSTPKQLDNENPFRPVNAIEPSPIKMVGIAA